jgi:type I restriction enzyme M protein
MGEEDIAIVVGNMGNLLRLKTSKIFENKDFGYNRVRIERPVRLLYQWIWIGKAVSWMRFPIY